MIAKDNFIVSSGGSTSGGLLFLMEEMGARFNDGTGDWRYTLIITDGKTVGATEADSDTTVKFCADCHAGAEAEDYLFFLPGPFRK